MVMNVLELYRNGIIDYLYHKGLLSGSTLSYIEYYMRYQELRKNSKGYRESVRILSQEFGVSETTIKKAIKILNN
jgi:HTH domain